MATQRFRIWFILASLIHISGMLIHHSKKGDRNGQNVEKQNDFMTDLQNQLEESCEE